MRTIVFIMVLMLTAGGLAKVDGQKKSTGNRSRLIGELSTGDPIGYAESHALVIGVSNYEKWKKLPGVMRDIEEVGTLLKSHGFRVETVVDPTRVELFNQMDKFISNFGLKEKNRLVIYFAGHGHTRELRDERQAGYIVMKDAPLPEGEMARFIQSALSMDEIETFAKRIESKHAMFVFDSCFSGSIFRSEKRPIPPMIASKAAESVRQFITSGTAKQQVPDESKFRKYFVRGLKGEADVNGDGYVTGEELGSYLTGKVSEESGNDQTPRYGKIKDESLNRGDMVFVVKGREEEIVKATPVEVVQPALDPEEESWKIVSNTNNPDDLKEFIKSYPEGRFLKSAEFKLRLLEKEIATREAEKRSALVLTPRAFTTGMIVNGNLIRKQGECEVYTEDLGNGVLLEMVKVPSGDFLMGENQEGAVEVEKMCTKGASSEEKAICKKLAESFTPQHRVRVKEFLMGKYEVTQRQWSAVMGGLPPEMEKLEAKFKGDDKPVVNVSWEEVKEFINKLGKGYRLPTEAEWEYAARGGMRSEYGFGDEITPEIVNYNGNFPAGKTKKGVNREAPLLVGALGVANPFGLYDMHGNVWEWCEDEFHISYNGSPVDGSAWVSGAQAAYRVIRGGSWYGSAVLCRLAYRSGGEPGDRDDGVGFRLSRTLPLALLPLRSE